MRNLNTMNLFKSAKTLNLQVNLYHDKRKHRNFRSESMTAVEFQKIGGIAKLRACKRKKSPKEGASPVHCHPSEVESETVHH